MRRGRDDLDGATAVLYARRSKHDPRNPGKSTADQIDTQRERASRLGLDVQAEFTDDGMGASRHSRARTRPGFFAAVEYLQTHPVEVMALWELSRATRRLRVYSDLMELCEDQGTYLLVGDRIYDPLDSTDQMVLGMTAVQDSAEVARLRERTLRGVASTAAQGRPHGRNIYGYERVYDPRTRALLHVHPHPEQAAVVREMVTRTLAGDSAHQIVRDLNSRGQRKPSGAVFHPGDVTEMLRRPAYRGLRDHKGIQVPAVWPALIEPAEWSRLRAVLARRSRGDHATTAKYLLTGVAFCAKCLLPMYADTKRSQYVQTYYQCGCGRSRNLTHLDEWTRQQVDELLADRRVRKELSHREQASTDGIERELQQLRDELDEAYALGLSPRGLATQEARLLPLIDDAERRLLAASDGPDLTGHDRLPDDTAQARDLLRGLVRVWVGPSRRGRGFDPAGVVLRLASDGPPTDRE